MLILQRSSKSTRVAHFCTEPSSASQLPQLAAHEGFARDGKLVVFVFLLSASKLGRQLSSPFGTCSPVFQTLYELFTGIVFLCIFQNEKTHRISEKIIRMHEQADLVELRTIHATAPSYPPETQGDPFSAVSMPIVINGGSYEYFCRE